MISTVAMDELLRRTAAMHHHLCPRQVLGVRMGMLAGRMLGLDLPQVDKRLFVFMETDGCTSDGVAVSSGAHVGRRTMYMMDFGKVAATFVDTLSGAAVRIHPHPDSRSRAIAAAADEPDRWRAQLVGYQRLLDEAFLIAEPVVLTMNLASLISRDGVRTTCVECGEEVSNEREVIHAGRTLCRACAGQAYCEAQRGSACGGILTALPSAIIAET